MPRTEEVKKRNSTGSAGLAILEQVFDGFAGALEYFGSPLYGTNSDVLPGVCSAFTQVGGSVDGVKRH